MDTLFPPEQLDSPADSSFVTEFDGVPGFWNFLLDLKRNDLIAELIQNDLDQEATRTVVSFEKDQLVCEGDGTPVDLEGWKRLRKLQGAGDSVPAKRGRIGVKKPRAEDSLYDRRSAAPAVRGACNRADALQKGAGQTSVSRFVSRSDGRSGGTFYRVPSRHCLS